MSRFILEDYCPVYYEVLKNERVPEDCEGKFVQIAHDEYLYVVFAPYELSKYHANIVERFCLTKNRNLVFVYNSKKDDGYIDDAAWEIKGGGHWIKKKKVLKLYGTSDAFGKYCGINLLKEILLKSGKYDSVVLE
ncbi:MAG: hypothetical protein ACE5FU_14250 [Nitrospinota bacterium]